MENLLRDLLVGLRQLRTDKSFSIAAILTLALGVGATAAMFTVSNALLFQELPYPEPQRLVMLNGTWQQEGMVESSLSSLRDLADWRQRSSVFSQMSAFGELAFNLEQGEQSRRLSGELVNAEYFALLGLKPALGRFFNPDEDAQPFEQYVAVLGHDLWRSAFGASQAVLGQSLQLNGQTYRVVGVAPAGFRGLTDEADLWVPSMVPPRRSFLENRRLRWVSVVARLAPGATLQQAQQQMDAVTDALARELPADNEGVGVAVVTLEEAWFGRLRPALLVLTLGAGILLLIACINVGNLLLTRAAARQRGYGIRIALGASRPRLARQLLTESVLLSLLGAGVGLLFGQWAVRALIAASGVRFRSFVDFSLQPGVTLAVVVLAVVCGLAFGLVPLALSFRTDLTRTLGRDEKPAARGGAPRFQLFQDAVVVAQVALALTLSAHAGLMAKSFRNLISQDLGFRSADLLTWRIDLRGEQYVGHEVVAGLLRREYLPRMAAVPGVARLELSNPTLPSDVSLQDYYLVEDHDSDAPDGTYLGQIHTVSPGYFNLLGIPLQKGRAFDAQDTASNVAVVSQSLADRQWPGADPLGKRIKLATSRGADKPWLTVVGVVADVRHGGPLADEAPALNVYLSALQFVWRPPLTVNFLVRPRPGVSTAQLRRALADEMAAINPELPIYDVATMAERLARQTDKARFQVVLIGLFSLLALLLAAVGIYGVLAYNVTQRRREIAIRVALGADRTRILRRVVGRASLLALVGLTVGLTAVFALGRLLVDLLFETSIADPLILGGTCLTLFLVSLLANYLPARRAAAADPVSGLRLQ